MFAHYLNQYNQHAVSTATNRRNSCTTKFQSNVSNSHPRNYVLRGNSCCRVLLVVCIKEQMQKCSKASLHSLINDVTSRKRVRSTVQVRTHFALAWPRHMLPVSAREKRLAMLLNSQCGSQKTASNWHESFAANRLSDPLRGVTVPKAQKLYI